MKNTLHKKYKGGNKLAKRGGGLFDRFLGTNSESGDSTKTPTDGENPLTKMIGTATGAAKETLGLPQEGESEISHLNGEIAKLKQEKVNIEEKFKADSQKMTDTMKLKQEEDMKKLKQEVDNKIKDIESKINDITTKMQEVIKKSQQNMNDLNKSSPASGLPPAPVSQSAPGSQSAPAAGGGGRRRRSGARRSGARRSGARNGRSGARRSGARRSEAHKSKNKKRVTRKKNRNHKKRTRRYKKQ